MRDRLGLEGECNIALPSGCCHGEWALGRRKEAMFAALPSFSFCRYIRTYAALSKGYDTDFADIFRGGTCVA